MVPMTALSDTLLVQLAEPLLTVFTPQERVYWPYLFTSLAIASWVYLKIHRGQKVSLQEWRTFLFPKEIYTHASWWNDVKVFYLNILLLGLFLFPVLMWVPPRVAVGIQEVMESLGLVGAWGEGGWGTVILYTLLVGVALDLGVFIAHYLQHKVPWLWEFHKVHHSAEVLNPLTAYRMHPVDLILNYGLSIFLVGVVQGVFQSLYTQPIPLFSFYSLDLLTFGFYSLGYHLRHSHVWLDYGPVWSRIFISPAQHQIHHSDAERHIDKNLGFIFAVWDRVFGTLYIPKEKESISYGLADPTQMAPLATTTGLYLHPFQALAGRWFHNPLLRPVATGLLILLLVIGLKGAELGVAGTEKHEGQPPVHLEEMTWIEVRDRIGAGAVVAVVPTGGTEQNGPHMVLGKHNAIVRHTAEEIARQLGNTLVAPVMAYVPEGDWDPPTKHMRFAGTLSVSDTVFEGLLEETARSLKAHGFKLICFVGDSGWNQSAQERVANRLTEAWRQDGVVVVHVSDYYAQNGQARWLLFQGYSEAEIGTHAGIRDTSELMAVHSAGIRSQYLKKYDPASFLETGVDGNPSLASAVLGQSLLDQKVRVAVRQIRSHPQFASLTAE